MKINLLILCILALCLAACNDSDGILLSYQHSVQVGFYSRNTKNDTTLTAVQVWGVGKEDTLLYDTKTQAIHELFLNLNMNANKTKFVVRTQTLQDELDFEYTTHLRPVSGSGGITMEIHVDSISHTETFIHSAEITNPDINYNESLENVQIFVY